MSVQSMSARGAIQYAARLINAGHGDAYIEGRLGYYYPGERPSAFSIVVREAHYAVQAGGTLAGQYATTGVPASTVPGYYTGRTGYQYAVLATQQGPAGTAPYIRTYIVRARSSLTLREVQARVRRMARNAVQRPPRGKESDVDPNTFTVTSYDVYSITRIRP